MANTPLPKTRPFAPQEHTVIAKVSKALGCRDKSRDSAHLERLAFHLLCAKAGVQSSEESLANCLRVLESELGLSRWTKRYQDEEARLDATFNGSEVSL